MAGGSALTLINEAAGGMVATGVVLRPIGGENITYCAVRSPTNDNPAAQKLVSPAKASDVHNQQMSVSVKTCPAMTHHCVYTGSHEKMSAERSSL